MTLKQIRIERLRQLQHERGLKGPVELGKLIGRKTNQTSDLLRGRAAFGEKVARSIEAFVGLPGGWLDRTDDEPPVLLSRKGIGSGGQQMPPATLGSARSAVFAAGAVALRQMELLDVSGSTAPATLALVEPLLLGAASLQQLGAAGAGDSLRFMHMSDDVMEPSIGIGDVLLVDVAVGECTRDGMYVLRANGRDYVRRVRLRLDGQYEISADSPAIKAAETVRNDQIQVLGRVLWGWRGHRF